jgi:hypothetical protein
MLFGQQQFRFGTDDKKGAEETSAKKEATKEEPKKAEEKKADTKKKAEESSTSSSDEDAPETLSKEDIQKIKKLIGEQDKEIETLKEQIK